MSRVIYSFSNVKLQKRKSINSIEQLSNEMFYEIFDYLLCQDIYKAFSNLNNRFENLLFNSSYLLTIRFSSESESIFDDRYKHLIDSNKYQIISLHSDNQSLINKFNILYTIDLSFNHLQSIILHEIATFQLMKLLFRLKSLPRLFSLTVFLDHCDDDLGDIYRVVFHLSYLKYFKLNISDYQALNLNIPIATNAQFSSIEYLVIYHRLTLNELTNLLSHTPQLTHLCCFNVTESEDDIKSEALMKLNNLRHLTISINHLRFDKFEKFLVKLSSQLRILSVTINGSDKNYLNGARFEYIISQHIPYLNKLIFCYTDTIDNDFEIKPCHALVNDFTSLFYLKRQWIFRIFINNDKIIYLIRPSRDLCHDFQEFINLINSSIYSLRGAHISIRSNLHTKENEPFINKIIPLFEMLNVTRLNIDCSQIIPNIFLKILSLLPNLDSMRIISFPPSEKLLLINENSKMFYLFLGNNKITKLSLRDIPNFEQMFLIMNLFSHIKFIELQQISNYNVELIIRCTLWKIQITNNNNLKTLCVNVDEGSHDELEKLQKMINSENLVEDYIIYRRHDKYYLEWK
ncbi:unnamed protein product [Rotaria sp. Silwood2]|nr:unnamed protein product [Rotaria sp. Silwood2]